MRADLNDERELSTLTRLACGGIAGTTGQTVAYPLDVVRRRMQVRCCCCTRMPSPQKVLLKVASRAAAARGGGKAGGLHVSSVLVKT